MDKQIIVDVNNIETTVALLEDGKLAELYIEREGKERLVGNIYAGRVKNVLPGMQAAFVDIGIDKNAFLYAGDILSEKGDLEFSDREKPEIARNISEIVKQGQNILVQILKEPEGTKGARITANITLPGRNIVLMPTVNYIGVSRRIEEEQERERLRNLVDELRPEGMGVIVRTAGKDKSLEEFAGEINYLRNQWDAIVKKANIALPPYLIHKERELITRTVRDLIDYEVSLLVINDKDAWKDTVDLSRTMLSFDSNKIKLQESDGSLIDFFDLQTKIDKLLNKKVWLKSGGYIIIEETEALTAIDVNTGKYVGNKNFDETVFNTNTEAAKEIAKQLRLRDVGGIIVIDFIDMQGDQHKDELIEILNNEVKKDRTKCNIVGMTGLGLVEMTRKKVRKKLTAILQDECDKCNGTGKVLNTQSIVCKIIRSLRRRISSNTCNNWLISCSNDVAAQMIENSKAGKKLIEGLESRNVFLKRNQFFNDCDYDISQIFSEDELSKAELNYDKL